MPIEENLVIDSIVVYMIRSGKRNNEIIGKKKIAIACYKRL